MLCALLDGRVQKWIMHGNSNKILLNQKTDFGEKEKDEGSVVKLRLLRVRRSSRLTFLGGWKSTKKLIRIAPESH